MKLLQINTSLNTSSTGKIVNQIGDMCIKNGDESYIMYSGRYSSSISKSITYKIGTRFDFYLHAFITRIVHDLAETLVIAKAMLRKKDRNRILDNNYNKYTTDDHEFLPDWFV